MTRRRPPPDWRSSLPLAIATAGWLALAAAVALWTPAPEFVERSYSDGIYPHVDHIVRAFSDFFRFSLGDALFIVTGLALLYFWIRALAGILRPGAPLRLLRVALGTLIFAAVLFLTFMVSWGYNYRRVPVADKIIVHGERNTDDVVSLGNRTLRELNANVGAAHRYTLLHETDDEMAAELHGEFRRVIGRLGGIPSHPPPRVKFGLFNWMMKATATTGFTNPWTHEITVVSSLLPFERPATYAHEWSHLSGFADESEANYISVLTCTNSRDPRERYAGWMLVWFNLPADLHVTERADPQVIADIEAIKARYRREVKPVAEHVQHAVYNAYLHANNVKAGIASYQLVVRLLAGADYDRDGLPVVKPGVAR